MDFQAIKAATSFEDAIALLGLTYKRHGNAYRAKCPACDSDSDRALVITPGKGFYCWAEKRGGDVIALVQHVKGIGAREAAQFLAATLPQEPQRSTPSGSGAAKESQQAPADNVLTPLSYLDHSQAFGLDEETAKALGIGYAAKGLMRGTIAVPVRTESGKLTGYIGIPADAQVKLPKTFKL